MSENHNFKKHFGQNFLRSHSDIVRFAEVIDPQVGDLIIEIGPGDGALTNELLARGASVHAIEIDPELIENLKSKFESQNFKITSQDVMTVDLGELISDYQGEYTFVKIVGSLPYNISKQIIRVVFQLTTRCKISNVSFLIQKEVAQDYTEAPPKAHFLYAMSRVFGNIEHKFSVDKEHFHPSPKVDGGVFKFVPYNIDSLDFESTLFGLDLIEKEKLVKFIKQGFSSPRKTVWNNLKMFTKGTGGTKKLRQGEFENAGFDPKIRAQNLEIADWYKLYKLCLPNIELKK